MRFDKILRSRRRRPHRSGRRLRFEPLEARHLLATFMVSNLDDSGPGSLRQAVLDSNGTAGADEIGFQAGLSGTIQLTSGQIEITDDLTLTGPGTENLTIDAQRNSRIFEIARKSGLVTIDGLTLTHGKTVEQGGAIRSVSAFSDTDDVLKIRNSVITGNTADRGGGGVYGFHIQLLNSTVSNNDSIFAAGGIQGDTIDIRDSDLMQNTGNNFYGSAAHGEHSLTIRDSSVSGNTGNAHAVSSFGDVLVTGSTVANNTAQFNAGIYGVSIRIHDSTITGNTAGSGNLVYGRGKILITESTISGNSVFAVFGDNDVTVSDSTISDNGGGVDSSDNVIVNNSSIIGNADVGIGANRDVTVTNSVISGNSREGIHSHRGLELSDSTVSNNGDQGIRVSGTATVVRSSIRGNLGAGIGAGKSVTATQTTIIGNDGYGISAYEVATVIDSTIAQNSGSGVIGDEGVSITGSAVSNNRDGGVFSYQAVEIASSAISGNTSQHDGGGVYTRGDLTIIGSTISENTAMDRGGGIYILAVSNLTVINSTISGNSAQSGGGGIDAGRARIVVSNSTITQNNSGISGAGGIFADEARSFSLHSSIVAGNFAGEICGLSDPPRCSTIPADISRLDVIDVTNSLIGDNFGTELQEAPLGSPDANGNLIGDSRGSGAIDPVLGPLQDNGGPTDTHLLLAGSPALDSGANPLGLEFDQRGLPRLFGAEVDMGAVEVRPVVFVVNTTGDAGDANPGDGVCDDGAGDCTLRAAIEEANANVNGAFPDEIHFAIPDEGPHTIEPRSPLPTIRDAVVIDGLTQPLDATDAAAFTSIDAPPTIEIDGSLAGAGASGLTISKNGSGSTIRNLVINRFDAHGIFVSRSAGNHIEQNFIGTDATGTVALGNGDAGVMILNAADNVVGGSFLADVGNVISGNRRGVAISGRLAGGNQILGNFVGVDASGVAELGNRGAGIEIAGAPNNVVGSFDGINVISGNRVGVEIHSAAATGNSVVFNKIGTDESGQTALPNRIGVSIRNGAAANQVLGNQIAGNLGDGVNLTRADGNRIDANQIGGDGLGNGGDGVDIRGGQHNAVGGNLAAASNAPAGAAFDLAQGNRISANGGFGVNVVGDDHLIQLNSIGTSFLDAQGNQRGGVQILKGSHNRLRENQILQNNGPGVLINGADATANRVQGNTIGAADVQAIQLPPAGNTVGVEIRNSHENSIGGSAPDEGNRIYGNDKYGIHIHGAATGNRVQGNVIGLVDLSHLAGAPLGVGPSGPVTVAIAVPNGRDGIFVESDGNVIGGTTEGAGNAISGNARYGVLLMGDGNLVQGNQIGTYADGTTAFPNGADGLRVHGSNNIISGTEPGAGNVIAFNAVSGVRISSGTGNAVARNSIYKNSGLGIDLGRLGPNANDGPLDADSGANNLQNTPEILRTQKTATHLQIIFYVPSQSPYSTYPIRAEFFVADDDGQEGQTFLASTEVTLPTPAVISIPLADIPLGAQIVATATDAGGNTSEISAPVATEPPPATTADAAVTDLVFQDFGE